MFYTHDAIRKVNELDIVQVLDDCGVDYEVRRGRRIYRCISPTHDDKHPSMTVMDRANKCHCFACASTFDVLDVITHAGGTDNLYKSIEWADKTYHLNLETEDTKERACPLTHEELKLIGIKEHTKQPRFTNELEKKCLKLTDEQLEAVSLENLCREDMLLFVEIAVGKVCETIQTAQWEVSFLDGLKQEELVGDKRNEFIEYYDKKITEQNKIIQTCGAILNKLHARSEIAR